VSTQNSILVVSPNWLGDVLMALPAVQAAAAQTDVPFAILTRPAFVPVWRMAMPEGTELVAAAKTDPVFPLARRLRAGHFAAAYVIPHSFRTARAPFLARIPERIGLPGHLFRDWMLTEIRRPGAPAEPHDGPSRRCPGHQAWEILDLFRIHPAGGLIPPPRLTVPAGVLDTVRDRIGDVPRPWIAFIPGAARGPSKQWPADHWRGLLQAVSAHTPGSILLLGTPNEATLCAGIASAAPIPRRVCDLSGKTTLEEMAAALALADAVCCNDSGGMHLAAAVGTPLVAFFGITDPDKTGPLGAAPIRILQHSARRTRDIPRHSPEAEAALRAITPEEAFAALRQVMAG
jgi:heptosyltransferase-2